MIGLRKISNADALLQITEAFWSIFDHSLYEGCINAAQRQSGDKRMYEKSI